MRKKDSAATSAKPNENSMNNTATSEEAPEAAQSKMEDEDEHADRQPEDGGQPAQLVAVAVQGDHVVLVGGGCKRETI